MPLLPLKKYWGVRGKEVTYFLNSSVDSLGNLVFNFSSQNPEVRLGLRLEKLQVIYVKTEDFSVVLFAHHPHLSPVVWRRFPRCRTVQSTLQNCQVTL